MKAMTVYNKLKIAILAIIASQSVSAIQLDPIQIQSGSGDLLYAEMKFSNSNPNEKIDVDLASAADMIDLRLSHQPSGHLNFFTRRSGDGSGVIVITSSRPFIEPELNILIKIKEGNATHIQQVKANLTRAKTPTASQSIATNEKTLTPQFIVSEKDIALNLPESTSQPMIATNMTPSNPMTVKNTESNTLAISTATLPELKNQVAQATPNAQTISPQKQALTENAEATKAAFLKYHPNTQITQQTAPTVQKAPLGTQKTTQANVNTQQKPAPQVKTTTTAQASYLVKANESLWSIANNIAAQTGQNVADVMRQLQADNQTAFIQGDPNRLRQGVALNLAHPVQAGTQQKFKPAPSTTVQKPSAKTKYRLNQAEMSIVAEQKQAITATAEHKNSQQNLTSAELSTKVMTAREKTVKLQNNVTQLSLALNQKNNRIQLLNARLAQIQQQLQQQAEAKKPK